MALRDWLPATATLATPATLRGDFAPSVAAVATVAVAAPANEAALPELATPAQEDQLRALIPLAFPGASDTDLGEALAAALSDPQAALVSFRALAGLQADISAPSDDRRHCTDCANLTTLERRCLAAWRGEGPINAPRTYHPVTDLPRRCECFKPLPEETDQRSGADRWPCLTKGGNPNGD
jgi:hypothetical protein